MFTLWSEKLLAAGIKKTLPSEYGKILSAAITVVPKVSGNAYQSGNWKCLSIRTQKGILTSIYNSSNDITSLDNAFFSKFYYGDYDDTYTSAFIVTSTNNNKIGNLFTVGEWAPATVTKDGSYIVYKYKDVIVAAPSASQLNNNNTYVVTGFTFTVNSRGVLTITYNGEVVMKIA